MTTLGDVLKGIRETIVLSERVEQLTKKVDQMDAHERDLIERLVRLETFVDFVRPAITRRTLPPSSN
ncbi:hypothetical protein [Metallibacterium sp.]|uniref:hypothetical protein n=1 Tax=Metallibacterium sp. TaxID=2940281 RepID=UPI0026081019|nr:hypothetical protein [Metallibacterium sp.]